MSINPAELVPTLKRIAESNLFLVGHRIKNFVAEAGTPLERSELFDNIMDVITPKAGFEAFRFPREKTAINFFNRLCPGKVEKQVTKVGNDNMVTLLIDRSSGESNPKSHTVQITFRDGIAVEIVDINKVFDSVITRTTSLKNLDSKNMPLNVNHVLEIIPDESHSKMNPIRREVNWQLLRLRLIKSSDTFGVRRQVFDNKEVGELQDPNEIVIKEVADLRNSQEEATRFYDPLTKYREFEQASDAQMAGFGEVEVV